MAWLGWLLAIVAGGIAIWLWRQFTAERSRTNELLYEKLDIENQMDALRAQHAVAPPADNALDEVAAHLLGPLHAVQTDLQNADLQLTEYRERVREFDAAVQYCLQPVELIFGADKATLDRLVSHVEGARRKLFEARSGVEKHPLHKGGEPLGGSVGEVRTLSDYVHSLRVPAATTKAGDDETTIDRAVAADG